MEIIEVTDSELLLFLISEYDQSFTKGLVKRIPDLKEYSQKLFKNSSNYIIKVGEEIAGFIFFYNNNFETKVTYISQLCIGEKFRRRGLASELLSFCELKSKELGMLKIDLEVSKENFVAQSLYKKSGYNIIKESEINTLYMEKSIL